MPPIAPDDLDGYLATHLIDPKLLRADDFEGFMARREQALLEMVGAATGYKPQVVVDTGDEGEELSPGLAHDSGLEVSESEQ